MNCGNNNLWLVVDCVVLPLRVLCQGIEYQGKSANKISNKRAKGRDHKITGEIVNTKQTTGNQM